MAMIRPSAALGRKATEKDLNYISQCIGSNWEMLGPFLIEINSTVTVEQIKENHRTSQQRVYNLLIEWRKQTDDQSLAHLFHSMYQAGTSVTIEWREIAKRVKVDVRDIRACKDGYQRPIQETEQQGVIDVKSSAEKVEVGQSAYNDLRRNKMSEPMEGVQESNHIGEPMEGVQESRNNNSFVDIGLGGRLEPMYSLQETAQDQRTSDVSQLDVDRDHTSVDGPELGADGDYSCQDSDHMSQRCLKDSCLYDGRLIDLTDDVVKHLKNENTIEIGKGSFGKVYRSNSPSKDFGMHVVVKKIPVDEGTEGSIRREMMISRILHPFILPLLAAVEQPLPDGKREFWFVSPFCENGDLYHILKNIRMGTIKVKLNAVKRVKILLQVALAIEYIHTAVPGVRAVIIHKDIASRNIVLDSNLNARLIDFGLARETDDVTSKTGEGGSMYYWHPDKGKTEAKESFDYYPLGVIVREMISKFGPEGNQPTYLQYFTEEELQDGLDKNIWGHSALELKVRELKNLSKDLLDQRDWKVQDFTKNIIEKLKKICTDLGETGFLDVSEGKNDKACHSCMINKKANQTSMNQKHMDNCYQKIEVCIACEKNSFLNPVTCYCGVELSPTIGHRWGALLVAGKDTKDVEISKAFTKDVKELEKLLTSNAPRIFGISKDNVRTVVPSAPDKVNDNEKLWPKVKEEIGFFSNRRDIDTLLIYFSCHGQESMGSGDGKDFKFQLVSSDDSITLEDFNEQLERLENIEKLIIVLDRCYPPNVSFKTDRIFIQINSCKKDEKAKMDSNGSHFTKFFIRGLKAKSEGMKCQDDCSHCRRYWKRSEDFITVSDLYDYIKGHLSGQHPICRSDLMHHSSNIAFFTGERVEIIFNHTKKIPVDHFKDINELKVALKKAFGKEGLENDKVCIQRDTFRKKNEGVLGQYLVCDNLDAVMAAWVQRQQLKVIFN